MNLTKIDSPAFKYCGYCGIADQMFIIEGTEYYYFFCAHCFHATISSPAIAGAAGHWDKEFAQYGRKDAMKEVWKITTDENVKTKIMAEILGNRNEE